MFREGKAEHSVAQSFNKTMTALMLLIETRFPIYMAVEKSAYSRDKYNLVCKHTEYLHPINPHPLWLWSYLKWSV